MGNAEAAGKGWFTPPFIQPFPDIYFYRQENPMQKLKQILLMLSQRL